MKQVVIKNKNNLDLVLNCKIADNSKNLVFIMHGFTACIAHRHIMAMVESFVNKGYSVVAIDATNSAGKSGIDEKGASFESFYNDLNSAVDWAKKQDWFQDNYILAGHSLGAATCLKYAADKNTEVSSVIAVSPLIDGKEYVELEKIRLGDVFDKWQETGNFERLSKTTGKKVNVPFYFIEDILKHNAYDFVDKIMADVYFINGENDELTPMNTTFKFAENVVNMKDCMVLKDCGHIMRSVEEVDDLRKALEGFTIK